MMGHAALLLCGHDACHTAGHLLDACATRMRHPGARREVTVAGVMPLNGCNGLI